MRPLIEKIKEYLSKDAEGNLKHEVWIDTSEIKAGKDWRVKITSEPLENVSLKVKPEQKAKLRICPMSIEPRAELPIDMKEIIILEKCDMVQDEGVMVKGAW